MSHEREERENGIILYMTKTGQAHMYICVESRKASLFDWNYENVREEKDETLMKEVEN